MGRRVEGRATEQCHIKALVRAGHPRVPPAGVFAWRGELASHASLRGSLCVGVAPRLRRPRLGRRQRLLVQTSGCRRRGGNSSCEAEICRARRRLFVRGRDLSGKPLPRWRLVGEASSRSETRRLASDGLGEDLELSLVLDLGLHIVDGVRRLHPKSDYNGVLIWTLVN
jgi:hypothetical protein